MPMTIDGTEYLIDIIGKDHDDYADGTGKAPLTFQLHDCYKTTYGMNGNSTNLNGWKNSNMALTSLPAILSKMPVEVSSAIKEVSKLTSSKGGSSTIDTSTNKLFLLSEVEIFGSTTHSVRGEGSQYDYYKQGNSTVKTLNGVAKQWWERSPYNGNDTSYCNVQDTGVPYNSLAGRGLGVSFAFCF